MLPKLPNTNAPRRFQIVNQRGINFTEAASDGELSNAYGLTTEHYPVLQQRRKRNIVYRDELMRTYGDATQIWEWDGKLLVIAEGSLYYGGEKICNVQDGQKQFAVVNTKLVIWPDKLMIDLTDNSYVRMDASIVTGTGVTFTKNSVNVPKIVKIATHIKTMTCTGYVDKWIPLAYTFGTDTSKVEECWVNGAWDMEKLSKIAVLSAFWNYGTTYHVIGKGDIIIPNIKNGTYGYGMGTDPSELTYPENDVGIYGVLTGDSGYYDKELDEWYNQWTTSAHAQYDPTARSYVGYFYDVYQCGAGTSAKLSEVFSKGDWVKITGTDNADVDGQNRVVDTVDDGTGTITFTTNYTTYPTGSVSDITIQKSIPDMDYICEKDNRLWGVSNKDKTIYASALGDPMDWWTYNNVSTDAYAVAIGSEGDFTGIISYGGGVCCFKQDRLHKILGSYPAEFYSSEYRIAGIQDGSNRSTIIANEVLYYKGVNGVYAYSGGTPTLISKELGSEIYTDAITGYNGNSIYICMADSGKSYHVFTYNLLNGLWMKESDEYILAYTALNSRLYALRQEQVEDNAIFVYDDAGEEEIEWLAEYAPIYETHASNSYSMSAMLNRKDYVRISIRIEVNGTLKVEVKADDEDWKEVKAISTDQTRVLTIPLPRVRCDKYQIRLSGKGDVCIRSMERELTMGSKR